MDGRTGSHRISLHPETTSRALTSSYAYFTNTGRGICADNLGWVDLNFGHTTLYLPSIGVTIPGLESIPKWIRFRFRFQFRFQKKTES